MNNKNVGLKICSVKFTTKPKIPFAATWKIIWTMNVQKKNYLASNFGFSFDILTNFLKKKFAFTFLIEFKVCVTGCFVCIHILKLIKSWNANLIK